jgi:hypothetical protein
MERFMSSKENEARGLLHVAMNPTRALFKGDIHENMPGFYKAGTLGLCHEKARIGDTIAVIYGCRYPLILRQVEGTDNYKMIGEAYVQGVMRGKAVGILPVVDICIC